MAAIKTLAATCSANKSRLAYVTRHKVPEQLIAYQQGVDGEGVGSLLHMSQPEKVEIQRLVVSSATDRGSCLGGGFLAPPAVAHP